MSKQSYVTPCGRSKNAKGEPYDYLSYSKHVESCPACRRILRSQEEQTRRRQELEKIMQGDTE